MDYVTARRSINSGDLLFVKRRGLVSILIRVFTAESFNHVAMALRNPSGVFIVEMREGKGWQLMPMSQWVATNKRSQIFWGKAPNGLRGSCCIERTALKYRGTPYSYWSLLTVWWSQLWNRKTVANLVCSTFVQTVYEGCSYTKSDKTFDPSDLMGHVRDVNKIE